MIKRLADSIASLQLLAFVLALLAGACSLVLLTCLWALHALREGSVLLSVAIVFVAAILALAAAARVPLALFFVFGAAIIVAVALLTGTAALFVPSPFQAFFSMSATPVAGAALPVALQLPNRSVNRTSLSALRALRAAGYRQR